MNTEYKKRSYNGNETIIRIGLLLECRNKFREMWVHFQDAIEVFGIDFINPGTNLVRRYVYEIIPSTYGSSLGNAAYMAAVHVQERTDGTWNPSCNVPKGFHSLRQPCHDKARNDGDPLRPTYHPPGLASSILSRTKVTISVRAAGGMVVVRRKDRNFKLTRPSGRV
jgi:hypothetical protein